MDLPTLRNATKMQFQFETDFDFRQNHQWMTRNWPLSFIIAIVYIVAVFAGKNWMKTREKFQLRGPLFLWNLGLAIFSTCGLLRTAPELLDGLQRYGFRYTVCNNSFFTDRISAVWIWLFAVSKLVELGDTTFIILRKSPLLFLHYYHHVTVMIYCIYTYHDTSASGRYFVVINLAVHSIMYFYFALKGLSVPIPRVVSMVITLLQLSQMAVGLFINYSAYRYKMAAQDECAVTSTNIMFSFLMYASYFVLFCLFFGNAYLRPAQKSQRKVE